MDENAWSKKLPRNRGFGNWRTLDLRLHNLDKLDLKPEAAGFSAVVYGHTHVPKQETKKNVLYFNPGAAGPRRFKLPVSVGKLVIENGTIRGEINILDSEKL